MTERPVLGESAPPIDLAAIDPDAIDPDAIDLTAIDAGSIKTSRWRLEDHRGRAVLLVFHRHIH